MKTTTDKISILVTGCGGDIGQSIGKILNESSFVKELYGCDVSEKNAAKFIYSNFFLGLPCSDESYLENLKNIVEKKKIDLVIPVSEPELRFFSRKKIYSLGNCELLTASPQALDIGFDKLETAKFLQVGKFPFPETFPISAVDRIQKFPVVVKSRTGSGSSNVSIVHDQGHLEFIKRRHPEYIVQEYLEGEECTCGVFRSAQGVVRTIILKRELIGGFTGYGEVIQNEEVENLLLEVAKRISLVGSINVQLRLSAKGAVIFEINPRFSSTVRFRHLLGFNDLEWSIADRIGIPIPDYEGSQVGKKIFKGFNEYIQ